MANHTGSEGVVKIGANTVAEVVEYSIEETGETIEDTTIGDTAKTFKPGNTSWTASITCHWDETDATGQGAMTVGTEVTLNVYPEGDTAGDTYFTGSAIVTNSGRSASINSIVSQSFSLQGTGALTQSVAV